MRTLLISLALCVGLAGCAEKAVPFQAYEPIRNADGSIDMSQFNSTSIEGMHKPGPSFDIGPGGEYALCVAMDVAVSVASKGKSLGMMCP